MRIPSFLYQFFTRSILIVFIIGVLSISGCDSVTTSDNAGKPDITADTTIEPQEDPTMNDWINVKDGLSYRMVNVTVAQDSPENLKKTLTKELLVIKIDPKVFNFEVVMNTLELQGAKSIEEMHKSKQADVSFNGAFFNEKFAALGLLISDGKILNPASSADLMNGIFVIDKNNNAQLLHSSSNVSPKKYPFAIQNGPVLLDAQKRIKITEDTGKKASRTAIGVDQKGQIIVIILQQNLFNLDNSLTLFEFAHILKENPFFSDMGLRSVLNLDGGTSSGAIIGTKYFPEAVPVQNIITAHHD